MRFFFLLTMKILFLTDTTAPYNTYATCLRNAKYIYLYIIIYAVFNVKTNGQVARIRREKKNKKNRDNNSFKNKFMCKI